MLFIVGKVYLKKKRQAFVSDPPALRTIRMLLIYWTSTQSPG